MKVFLNGAIVTENRAKISVFDRGFLYGDGVYETMLCRNGGVFLLKEHIARLFRSARMIALPLPWTQKYFHSAVEKTVAANSLDGARVRVTVSRGRGAVGYTGKIAARPTLVIAAVKFNGWPRGLYENGVGIIISVVRRNHPLCIPPASKSANCLNQILAAQDAKRRDAFEAILLNTDGFVAEGTISNIFIVKNNRLLTPSLETGILDGVTRRAVIRLARRHGIEVAETLLKPDDVINADECFITSSTLGVMPVARIGAKKFKRLKSGGKTLILSRALELLIDKETQK
ncbi:MAG: hypothetical protein A2314_05570 [Elusimicrobia bacterium RIFOXYB2_FULL_50_12]|nr:MAG: hypothetical protein A2314_05570 [Elusimicrobia bacterium RIFOXYB2_FULL_50_12]